MKILILCSGGDGSGMNRFIYEIYNKFKKESYFALSGFSGLINGEIYPLSKVIDEKQKNSAGSIIKTSRCPEFKQRKYFYKALENAKKFDYVIICGGNGSEKGAKELFDNGVKTIFVPGTIDNDVLDSFYSIGFSTAVKECVYTIENTMPSIKALNNACLFEVMGRYEGDIAKAVDKIVKADYLVVDKKYLDYEKMVNVILKKYIKGQSAFIIVRENIEKIEKIAKNLNKAIGLDIVKYQVVGRTQRGGNPTSEELEMAQKFAEKTIYCIENNKIGRILVDKNMKTFISNFR